VVTVRVTFMGFPRVELRVQKGCRSNGFPWFTSPCLRHTKFLKISQLLGNTKAGSIENWKFFHSRRDQETLSIKWECAAENLMIYLKIQRSSYEANIFCVLQFNDEATIIKLKFIFNSSVKIFKF
jgi:hypothetical protein